MAAANDSQLPGCDIKMEERKFPTDELHAKGKKPAWDNFSLGIKVQSASSAGPTAELTDDNPAKTLTQPSSVQRQAQDIIRQSELWPVYGVFLFAFAMLGYTLYQLGS